MKWNKSMHACMLSRFSHIWLCVTPWTAAHQAPLSTGFSRQECCSGLPFPSPEIRALILKWDFVLLKKNHLLGLYSFICKIKRQHLDFSRFKCDSNYASNSKRPQTQSVGGNTGCGPYPWHHIQESSQVVEVTFWQFPSLFHVSPHVMICGKTIDDPDAAGKGMEKRTHLLCQPWLGDQTQNSPATRRREMVFLKSPSPSQAPPLRCRSLPASSP